MLPRARRVCDLDRVRPFRWAPEPDSSAALARPALPDPVVETAERQAQLADLEREAFTKGYAQGERAGLEAGGKRAEAMLRRLGETIEELAGLRTTIVRQTERQIVELALAIAKRVLRREIALDTDFMVALARVALERLGDHHPATVRLHPDEYALVVGQNGPHWAGAHVQIVADATVSRGGCRVESDFGLVEAGVDAQLAELSAVLLAEDVPGAPRLLTHAD